MRKGIIEPKEVSGAGHQRFILYVETLLRIAENLESELLVSSRVPPFINMRVNAFTRWNAGNEHGSQGIALQRFAQCLRSRQHISHWIPDRFMRGIEFTDITVEVLKRVVTNPDIADLTMRRIG